MISATVILILMGAVYGLILAGLILGIGEPPE